MRTTPPTIRPIKHGSPADNCLWVVHVRWQPQTLYNQAQLQEALDTDRNVYTIGTVWNMCDRPHKSYTVSGAGTHSLMWQYIKDGGGDDGSDRGWAVGGPRPTLHHANRQSSICNHQSEAVYEYDVYGQPAAADPGHPNPFVFTGRRFDPETGLYYYRARYYNPTIGRFLQTDPIGYADGMNMYMYCLNNPLALIDPSGLIPIYNPSDGSWVREPGEPNLYPAICEPANGFPSYGPYFAQNPAVMTCVAAR